MLLAAIASTRFCSTIVTNSRIPKFWVEPKVVWVEEGSLSHLRGIRQNRKYSTDWDGVHKRKKWPEMQWFKGRSQKLRRAVDRPEEVEDFVLRNFETVAEGLRVSEDSRLYDLAAKMRDITGVDFRQGEPPELEPAQIESLIASYRQSDLPACEHCARPITDIARLEHAIRNSNGKRPTRFCDDVNCLRAAQNARQRESRRRRDIGEAIALNQAVRSYADSDAARMFDALSGVTRGLKEWVLFGGRDCALPPDAHKPTEIREIVVGDTEHVIFMRTNHATTLLDTHAVYLDWDWFWRDESARFSGRRLSPAVARYQRHCNAKGPAPRKVRECRGRQLDDEDDPRSGLVVESPAMRDSDFQLKGVGADIFVSADSRLGDDEGGRFE